MEAMAKVKEAKIVSEGVVRMKLLVRKQDLTKMLEEVSRGRRRTDDDKKRHVSNLLDDVGSFALEQRLIIMRKRRQSRRANDQESPWKPMLHSIPEEQERYQLIN
ncbi:hypothetical protein QQ045_007073 [Rhodiola kirilowii]